MDFFIPSYKGVVTTPIAKYVRMCVCVCVYVDPTGS